MAETKILNGLSIDWEEYYHAENLKPYINTNNKESHITKLTEQILEILDQHNTKITFFILGEVAKEHPNLIKKIDGQGHEIASHGYRHQLIYNQTNDEFFDDINITKILLEDLIGKQVVGYRAPNFSITDKTPWVYQELIKAGYQYSSSIFPIYHHRYSNIKKQRFPYYEIFEEKKILEIPLSTFELPILKSKFRFPVAGGAYWRLLPLKYNLYGLKRINNVENKSSFTYFHPWEYDQEQPNFDMPLLKKIRHYGGNKKFLKKLEIILRNFRFARYDLLVDSNYNL